MFSISAIWAGFTALQWVQTLWKYRIWIISGITALALTTTIGVLKWKLHTAEAELAQSASDLKIADHDLDIAQQDVTRWTLHSAGQDAEIASLNRQLAQHIADAARADRVAQANADAQAAAVATLQSQIQKMKEQARAHPDQVRPLGPIVLDVLHADKTGTTPAPAAGY
ncbi:MAG TPA: hypothetical protein VND94_01125 [Terriglobia bacterium]|nr:hypothetical protein [Terriglobia bacterium]